jgi:multiple sugar transport system substrate-binding protein
LLDADPDGYSLCWRRGKSVEHDATNDLIRAASEGRLSRRQVLVRASALGLSMSAVGGLLAACGSSSSGPAATAATGGPVTGEIKMLKGPHAANENALEAKLIRDFNVKQPGVKVDFSTYDWAQMNAQLNAAFASGSPPDVLYLTDGTYPYYAEQGVLEDMTPYVKATDYQSEWNAVYPFARNLSTSNGKIWGLPVLGAVYLITVNKDLLAQTGVSDWNSSYDRMREAAQKATKGDVYGFSMRTALNDYAYWDWFPYMHDADADILTKDLTAPGLKTADSPGAMQFLIDLHQKYKVTPPVGEVDWQGQKDLFKAGRIAIHHDDSTLINELLAQPPKFKWDIAMVPPAANGKQTVMGNFGFLCMAKSSKNKAAAWEWMKYWASAPAVSWFASKTTLQVVRDDVDVKTLWKGNDVMARIQSEFVPKVQGLQPHPKMQQMLTTMWPRVEAAYRGQLDGVTTITQADQAIQGVLG